MVRLNVMDETIILSCLKETGEKSLNLLYLLFKCSGADKVICKSTLRNYLIKYEEEGYIESRTKDNKKIYNLTKKGEEMVKGNKTLLTKIPLDYLKKKEEEKTAPIDYILKISGGKR